MGKGGIVTSKKYSKRRNKSKDKGSDESDEDYMVGEDEEFNDSEEYCSLAGEEFEESLSAFEEEVEEKVRKIGRSKGRKFFPDWRKNEVGKARKKRRAKVEDDEDFEVEEYDDEAPNKRRPKLEDDEDFEVEKYDEEEEEEFAPKRRAKVEDDDDDDLDDKDFDLDDADGNDEEFAPEDIDFDDEDELAVRTKNKKVGRRPLRELGHVKGRKRKRSSRFMEKPMRKKRTKSRRSQRKSAAGSGGAAFIENPPVVKEKSKRSFFPRKRNIMADPDSDFMSSGSSDYKYSISEEEREQVREASRYCRDLTISLRNLSSTKRLQEGVVGQQRKRTGRKGKEKVEELNIEAGKQVCGICLTEEGKTTVRGTLNCCSHYFCFDCIMEWSKVESRCPLCKQRFVNISKPARTNVAFDLRTVVVQVPERDQVYQPSEEELRGYLDPYETVICTECQQGGDDAFMLLCDICDSPAHTYCIGLGREVPEGNWYCEGCRPITLSYSNSHCPNLTPDQRTINDTSNRSFPYLNVREAIDLNSEYVPESPSTQAGSPVSGGGVSTLSQRRRILQLHHLLSNGIGQFGGRTNWPSVATSASNVVGSQITPQRFPPQQTISQQSLQGNFTPSSQSRGPSLPSSSHLRDHLIRGQTSTSGDGAVNRIMQAGLAGISRGGNSSGSRTNGLSSANWASESPSTQAGSPVSGAGVSTLPQRSRILEIHPLLNNGRGQSGNRTNWASASTSGNNVLGSQITPERFPPQQTISQRSLHGNSTPSIQSRDLSLATSSHSRDQLIQGQTSTSGDGAVHRIIQAGLAGISRGVNSSGSRTNGASAANWASESPSTQAGSPVSGAGVSTLPQRSRILEIHPRLNNGRSQSGNRPNGASASTSGINVLSSQITPERFPPQQTISQRSLHGNSTPSIQSRDLSWATSSHSRDQLIQGRTSTSGGGAVHRIIQAGLAGISRGINSSSGYEQLHLCSTSRSSIVEDSMAPCGYREVSPFISEKEQVKSMVRRQLKSLSREMELGYSAFKDVARISTHTILAACCLQHRGSDVYPVHPPSVCDHVGEIASGEISLMKGYCSSCFDSFVSYVVREITKNTRTSTGRG